MLSVGFFLAQPNSWGRGYQGGPLLASERLDPAAQLWTGYFSIGLYWSKVSYSSIQGVDTYWMCTIRTREAYILIGIQHVNNLRAPPVKEHHDLECST